MVIMITVLKPRVEVYRGINNWHPSIHTCIHAYMIYVTLPSCMWMYDAYVWQGMPTVTSLWIYREFRSKWIPSFQVFRIAGWWVESARGGCCCICWVSHISAHFRSFLHHCTDNRKPDSKQRRENVEKVWAKFDAIVMIRRGGGLARGFIQLAVEEKKLAGAGAEETLFS